MGYQKKRRSLAVTGRWLPAPIDFLRSRACAELSPLGAKMLLDVLALLGPNCTGNGDLCLTPKTLAIRGWSSRASILAAVRELLDYNLLAITRRESRTSCRLYACTLFPIDCDPNKLDAGAVGSYRSTDYMHGGQLSASPTEANPATWRRARKTI